MLKTKIFWQIISCISIILAIYLFFRFLLVYILPFLIALLLARIIKPSIATLKNKLKIPKPLGAAIMTLSVVGLIVGIIFLIGSIVFSEINKLKEQLPVFASKLPIITSGWKNQIDNLISAAPVSLQDILKNAFTGMLSQSNTIPTQLYQTIVKSVSNAALALPGVFLFFIAMMLSTYFISCDYDLIIRTILKPFSVAVKERIIKTKDLFMTTIVKWLKAQGLLMIITFSEVFIGLTFLKQDYALIFAFIAALLDALPMIGVGFVLIPWSLIAFFSEDKFTAFGLLILYAIINVVRGVIEPKIVGAQMGQHPMITLIAMYIGFKTFSVVGMITFPIIVIVLKQIFDWGWLKKSNKGVSL